MIGQNRRASLEMPPNLTRRGFLTAGVSSIAAASLGACAAPAADDRTAGRPALTRPSGLEDDAWADVRAQFILEAGTAYMNNASLGMPPAAVAEAVGAGYELVSREPIHAKHDLRNLIANRIIPGLATLFGADSDELVLTRNASEALYIGTMGIDLESGDEVLVTSQEHPAGSCIVWSR